MSVFKDFWNFITARMLGTGETTITSVDLEGLIDSAKAGELAIYEFALHSGINIIANALSACEIRTFVNWEEVQGPEYYLWNYSPHINYNANEFMQRIVWNLIYRNECLVIETPRGELMVADTYERDQYALYPDIFRNVTVCSTAENGVIHPYTFNRTFRMDEVLFYRLSSKNITELLQYLVDGYNSLLENAIAKFNKSAGEHGILTIDGNAAAGGNFGTNQDGSPRTMQDEYAEMMNKRFGEYFRAQNAVMPMWKGFSYDIKGNEASKKSTSDVKDVTDLTAEIYTKVANALQIPPQLLLGTVSDVEAVTRNLITFAIKPIADMIETENNRKRNGQKVLQGTYQMIDTTRILYTDILARAQGVFNILGTGTSVDEIREMTGRPPLRTEWSQKPLISRNFANLEDIDKLGRIENGGNDPPEGINPQGGNM